MPPLLNIGIQIALSLHKMPDNHWVRSIIVAYNEVENTACVYT
jgi:hypothetical protein